MRYATIISAALLAGCSGAQVSQGAARPAYDGVQTRLLDGDLVGFNVALRGADDPQPVLKYAECAAAQYALIRGYGFARHVRTNLDREGGTWRADAVYTISPDLPAGAKTIDAEVTVANCGVSGIPTA